jgi:hypothetical protein
MSEDVTSHVPIATEGHNSDRWFRTSPTSDYEYTHVHSSPMSTSVRLDRLILRFMKSPSPKGLMVGGDVTYLWKNS